MTGTSREDLEAMLRRAGLSLSAKQVTQIEEGWKLVVPMLDRLRDSERDRFAEPAHVFRADTYIRRSHRTEKP